MKEYPLVPLGTLISQAKKVRCGEEDYPVLSMTMHNGLIFQDKKFKKVIASQDRSNYKVVYRNQLVISFPIDEGVLAAQRITDAGIVSPAYGIWDIDQEKILPEFLECALRCERALNYYKSKLRGSTARRRSLPTSTLLAFNVPLPSISEQLNVLAIVHKLKSVIDTRKEEINVLDKLVKARFVEMLGDPGLPNRNYPIIQLEDIADVKSSHRIFTSDFVEEGIPFYRGKEIGELARGEVPKEVYYISTEKYKEISNDDSKPLIGDLLMPSICDKGQVWMVNTESPFYYKDGRVLCISPDRNRINPQYFQHYIKMRTISEYPKLGSGSTFAEFKIFQLKRLMISLPPLDRQNQFAEIVTRINKSKVAIDHGVILIRKALQSGYHNVWGN
ncbi:restriction endonuclease subunit S [Mitsuokella multacida]|uniref:restriction endonuclease subunit S n=1 Tax=Mitsuokella multacida TaxID=52226 RepID=UPI00242D85D8|nr:restriction endonuclease subunit S [Mitsuokella multacida]